MFTHSGSASLENTPAAICTWDNVVLIVDSGQSEYNNERLEIQRTSQTSNNGLNKQELWVVISQVQGHSCHKAQIRLKQAL